MKNVIIEETFEGYPNGKDRVVFLEGEEREVSDAFGQLIIDKGHAREKPAAEAAKSETKSEPARAQAKPAEKESAK